MSVTQTEIDGAFTAADSAFSVVNAAFTGLSDISELNDNTQTASVLTGYQLNAVNGVVTHDGSTYCSYEDYAKGNTGTVDSNDVCTTS